MKKQTLTQKKGEVQFRRKIAEQHTGVTKHFTHEFDNNEMLIELTKRRESTATDFTKFTQTGISFSPFLEVGAEYGVRGLVLANQYGAHGVCLDISQPSLSAMSYFAKQLGFAKLPLRICADAETLPFADDSFRFVFCYQTLHHFPNPKSVVRELFRVLTPGGYFFFADEPVKQTFNFDFFRRPTKIQGFSKLLKIIPILPFISTIGKTETDHGVLEASYPLHLWLSLLEGFEQIEITLESLGETRNYVYKPPEKLILSPSLTFRLWFFGGSIKSLGRKPLQKKSHPKPSIVICCPTCKSVLENESQLRFKCTTCKRTFSYRDGVLQLFPRKLERILYTP